MVRIIHKYNNDMSNFQSRSLVFNNKLPLALTYINYNMYNSNIYTSGKCCCYYMCTLNRNIA